MEFIVSADVVFGSGSAAARLVIDGRRVAPEQVKRNGCVQYGYADIPLGVIRKAKVINLVKDCYPGGKSEFTGSGRELLKQLSSKGWKTACQDFTHPAVYTLKDRILHRAYHYWRSERALTLAKKIHASDWAVENAAWKNRILKNLMDENPSASYILRGENIYQVIYDHDPGHGRKLAKLRKELRLVA